MFIYRATLLLLCCTLLSPCPSLSAFTPLYECEVEDGTENATAINCAYTTESPVKVCNCIEIKDIYEKFAEYRKEGLFDIKPFDRIPEKEMAFVLDDMRSTIEKNGLKNDMNNPMSKFIAENFPMLWN